jgi:hypothetical protein
MRIHAFEAERSTHETIKGVVGAVTYRRVMKMREAA